MHHALASLAELGLTEQCARQPGQKETRFRQCLGADTDISESDSMSTPVLPPSKEQERLAHLEQEVASLSQDLADLRQAFAQFKQQFE